ncbi:hypothetical protein JMN32_18185 [Fulvivirga sp. 29W222]|uniref:Uncharacterized protein n=1 Tax=Fulvivirga marina TaxID=2494733 RepID=A0A937KDA0_9BACT|nr:hypothetical protein [Fulvivirga marina]MBL6448249.1 hypothetical protein [Fulvivirga marina]
MIDFKINQDFIAKVLCINKDEPITTCNGKCYLSKELKKAEEKEDKQAPTSKEQRQKVVYYYVKSSFNGLIIAYRYLDQLNAAYNNSLYSSSFVVDIFRPPKLNLI